MEESTKLQTSANKDETENDKEINQSSKTLKGKFEG